MPTTSYILDMMKALYVTNSDPSEMGNDPVNGLEEKERDYAKLTHDYLATIIPERAAPTNKEFHIINLLNPTPIRKAGILLRKGNTYSKAADAFIKIVKTTL